MQRRNLFAIALAAGAVSFLPACGKKQAELKPILVGSTAGTQSQIAENAAKIAAKLGLQVKVVEFSDYNACNGALAAGDIDVNIFQHKPYLNDVVKTRGYKFVSIGQSHILPIGVYSKKIKDKKDIPQGALVTISNDPTNLSRSLQLLQREGLIKIKDSGTAAASVLDIVENPLNLKFKEIDSGFLVRSLDDADLGVVNGGWAIAAGLQPGKDSIALEDGTSPFAIQIVVREADKDRPEFEVLKKAVNSEEQKKWLAEKFKGAVAAAF